MNDTELLEKDISEIIGIDALPDEEKSDMLSRIGELILESVMLRIIARFSDEETAAFEEYLKTDPDPEALVARLSEIAPDIDAMFKEEVLAFKKECVAVMSRQREKV